MLFPRHPRPVVDSRPVAVQVVQQKVRREPVRHVLAAPRDEGAQAAECTPAPGQEH